MRKTALKDDKCYFVKPKPNAGNGVNEGEVPAAGVPNIEEPQLIEVIDVDAYAQLLANVEGLKRTVGE